jgi:hypothetical protein
VSPALGRLGDSGQCLPVSRAAICESGPCNQIQRLDRSARPSINPPTIMPTISSNAMAHMGFSPEGVATCSLYPDPHAAEIRRVARGG